MKERETILKNMPVFKALYKLSTPAMIAMTLNASYNIIDTVFVGQKVGALGIAGLGIAFPLQALSLGIAGMFGMGSASIISRRLGARKKREANISLVTGYFYTLVVAITCTVLGLMFLEPILKAFGATEQILPHAKSYMGTIFIGFTGYMSSIYFNNTVRSEGAAHTFMVSMSLGAILNITLDYIFLYIFNLGIFGSALATIIAQYSSAIYLLSFYLTGRSLFKLSFSYLSASMNRLRNLVAIGSSAFFIQAGNSLLVIFLNRSLGYYGGDIMISVYGVINKVLSFSYLPAIGIRQGAQPIIGYAYGAKNYARARETVIKALLVITIYSVSTFILLLVFTPQVFKLFANDAELITSGITPMRIVAFSTPLLGLRIFTSTLYQSIGFAKEALLTSVLRFFVIIPLIFILSKMFGVYGCFLSITVGDLIVVVICGYLIKHILDTVFVEKKI